VKVLAIVGPTACGKTALAVELAHRLGSEIISADSRQVYRGLDIGTGKDLDEYRRVDPPMAVHLIDVVDVDQVYTLAHFVDDFHRILDQLVEREPFSSGVPVVLCGGTGLYVEAALRAFDVPRVPPDPALRAELEPLPLAELIARLEQLAPELAPSIDTSTKRRVIRGIERAVAPPAVAAKPRRKLEPVVFVLDPPTAVVDQRIAARLRARVEQGLIEEVAGLLERGVPLERLQTLGLEYRELGEALAGRRSVEEALERLEVQIRRFAKRQRTWFRGMPRRGIPTITITSADADQVWHELARAGKLP
jgi:tRNA dimethylallyltransferase